MYTVMNDQGFISVDSFIDYMWLYLQHLSQVSKLHFYIIYIIYTSYIIYLRMENNLF